MDIDVVNKECNNIYENYYSGGGRIKPNRDKLYYKLYISVNWYTIGDEVSWNFQMNVTKEKNNIVVGGLAKPTIDCYMSVWKMYMGKPMPESILGGRRMCLRPEIEKYPRHLIEYLSSLKDDDYVHSYMENYYKIHLITDGLYRNGNTLNLNLVYNFEGDLYPSDKEISKFVMYFDSRKSIDKWVSKFRKNIKSSVERELNISKVLD